MVFCLTTALIGCSIDASNERLEETEESSRLKSFPVTYRCVEDCGGSGVDSVDVYTKQWNKPYGIEIEKKERVNVRFSFVYDCCVSFEVIANIVGDTLEIETRNKGDVVCDCICSYRYEVSFIEAADLKGLKINSLPVRQY